MKTKISYITVDGMDVELVRKSIRTLRLRVLTPDGRVSVSAPWLVPNAGVAAFVRANAAWIAEQREKLALRPAAQEHGFESGETLTVWGRAYTLELRSNGRRGSLELVGDHAILTAPPDWDSAKRESFVTEWYRERLKEGVAAYLPKWEERTGLRSSSWQSKRMKTRWGSCNTRTKKIWLNLYLAQTPMECLEYVILHELAHLRFADHGAQFKALLDEYMPDWRQRRKLLNSYEPSFE